MPPFGISVSCEQMGHAIINEVIAFTVEFNRHGWQNECKQPTRVLPLVIGNFPQIPHCWWSRLLGWDCATSADWVDVRPVESDLWLAFLLAAVLKINELENAELSRFSDFIRWCSSLLLFRVDVFDVEPLAESIIIWLKLLERDDVWEPNILDSDLLVLVELEVVVVERNGLLNELFVVDAVAAALETSTWFMIPLK